MQTGRSGRFSRASARRGSLAGRENRFAIRRTSDRETPARGPARQRRHETTGGLIGARLSGLDRAKRLRVQSLTALVTVTRATWHRSPAHGKFEDRFH
jgi:hypothetical protein